MTYTSILQISDRLFQCPPREVRGGLINILHFFKKVLALLAYVHFLLYLRTPPALECIPPKLLSHYAAHLP